MQNKFSFFTFIYLRWSLATNLVHTAGFLYASVSRNEISVSEKKSFIKY